MKINNKLPVNILLENVRSALNVGAIFRTCDATNINKLFLTGITPYPPHNKIPKTALGSIETVDWVFDRNPIDQVKKLKKTSQLIAVEITNNSRNIFQYKFEYPSTLIFGNEINGVSKELLQEATQIIHIPMFGMKESLNVSTTVGIVLYEIIRQFHYSK